MDRAGSNPNVCAVTLLGSDTAINPGGRVWISVVYQVRGSTYRVHSLMSNDARRQQDCDAFAVPARSEHAFRLRISTIESTVASDLAFAPDTSTCEVTSENGKGEMSYFRVCGTRGCAPLALCLLPACTFDR